MAKIEMLSSSINQNSEKPKKKFEKVVTGKVTMKEQSDIQKLASSFLAEDLKTVRDRIITEYALPMLKNGLYSILSSAFSIALFGEDQSRSNNSNYSRNSRNSYDGYYKQSNQNRGMGPRNSAATSWQEAVMDTRADAEEVLSQMKTAICDYGQVSVGDFYDLMGTTHNYTDNNYGWYDLDAAWIKAVAGGYQINFPKPTPLNR